MINEALCYRISSASSSARTDVILEIVLKFSFKATTADESAWSHFGRQEIDACGPITKLAHARFRYGEQIDE